MVGSTTFSWRAVLLSAVLGGALGYVLFARSQPIDAESRTVTTRADLYPEELDTVRLFKEAAPSVVYVTATKGAGPEAPNKAATTRTGTGSGFVWDDAGHIVTNFHVIGSFDQATVSDVNQHEYPAEVIGVSPENDLAVLKITPVQKLRPIPLGTSGDLQVGQKVFAIGNPFGFDHTLTTGIVSAVGREIPIPQVSQPIENVIQTDAAINPGNSGGPLLDSAGRLIGVNAALWSPTGASVGVGFAIPADTVNKIVPQLIKAGRGRPTLGLVCGDRLSQMFQRRNGTRAGVAVLRVLDGSAAQAAGLRAATQDQYNNIYFGDVLLQLDATAVGTVADVETVVAQHKPGDTIQLTYVHEGRVVQKRLMLDSSMNIRG